MILLWQLSRVCQYYTAPTLKYDRSRQLESHFTANFKLNSSLNKYFLSLLISRTFTVTARYELDTPRSFKLLTALQKRSK